MTSYWDRFTGVYSEKNDKIIVATGGILTGVEAYLLDSNTKQAIIFAVAAAAAPGVAALVNPNKHLAVPAVTLASALLASAGVWAFSVDGSIIKQFIKSAITTSSSYALAESGKYFMA